MATNHLHQPLCPILRLRIVKTETSIDSDDCSIRVLGCREICSGHRHLTSTITETQNAKMTGNGAITHFPPLPSGTGAGSPGSCVIFTKNSSGII